MTFFPDVNPIDLSGLFVKITFGFIYAAQADIFKLQFVVDYVHNNKKPKFPSAIFISLASSLDVKNGERKVKALFVVFAISPEDFEGGKNSNWTREQKTFFLRYT